MTGNGIAAYVGRLSVRSAAVLTTSYVAGTVIGTNNYQTPDQNQLIVYWSVTLGSLTSAQLKIEFSDDNSTFYQETAASISGGTETDTLLEHTVSNDGNYRLAIPIKDRYVKISVKGTGTVTGSSVSVDVITGLT